MKSILSPVCQNRESASAANTFLAINYGEFALFKSDVRLIFIDLSMILGAE
ncbi:hypothetical protein APA_80 [Pseudanabaena sp. lw0831]|nr:hypothetical protein APA_80 [Pseudanabaena sp. lw0831]